jgi:hypothetical protein
VRRSKHRKAKVPSPGNGAQEEDKYKKAELGADEEVVKRKPTVRYELADEPVTPAELRGSDPEPRELES